MTRGESVFFEIHTGNPQEGPGSAQSTARAWSLVARHRGGAGVGAPPAILDIGCGPGRQSLDLACLSGGMVTAVDNHQPFLDVLAAEAERRFGGEDRSGGQVVTVNADMADLPFADGSFDVVWSEAAAYHMTFSGALTSWRRLLKPGGLIAVSEISWLADGAAGADGTATAPTPPDRRNAFRRARDFWAAEYPSMGTVAENKARLRDAGYELIDTFTLPASDWWAYYDPIEHKLADFRSRYADDPEVLEVIASEAAEMQLYRDANEFYGYVFYVGRKK